MADSTDVILRLAGTQWSSAMRAKDRAAARTSALLISAAVLQATIVITGFEPPSIMAAGLMVALGFGGLLASRRHARRLEQQMDRFRQLAARLDELAPDAGLVALEQGPIDGCGLAIWPAAAVPLALVALGVLNVALVLLL
ncbi:MAG: hypothetical protein ACYS15_17965 [Planctomycetota bacterium]|jgi:hypothetical protein